MFASTVLCLTMLGGINYSEIDAGKPGEVMPASAEMRRSIFNNATILSHLQDNEGVWLFVHSDKEQTPGSVYNQTLYWTDGSGSPWLVIWKNKWEAQYWQSKKWRDMRFRDSEHFKTTYLCNWPNETKGVGMIENSGVFRQPIASSGFASSEQGMSATTHVCTNDCPNNPNCPNRTPKPFPNPNPSPPLNPNTPAPAPSPGGMSDEAIAILVASALISVIIIGVAWKRRQAKGE